MHWLHAHQRQSSSPREQASRARARREMNVLLQGTAQPVLFLGSNFGERHEIAVEHFLGFGRQHISQPTGHAGTEIQAERPEDHGYAAGHVLATVLADALDYGKRTAIPDSETLAGAAGNKELARRGAVEHRVSGKNATT